MNPESKQVKENLVRAKTYLVRGDVLKSIQAAVHAIEQLSRTRFIGKEKIEVEFNLTEYFKTLNTNPNMKEYFKSKGVKQQPTFTYSNEREQQILKVLKALAADMEAQEREQEKLKEKKKAQRKDDMLQKAQELLDSGDHPKAKALLRRVADAYGQEPGVITNVGERMLKAGLLQEAAEMLEFAMEQFPTDGKAYHLCIDAYMEMREFGSAEATYQKALRGLGGHPKTYLNMAKMYVEWRKWGEAYDAARTAYDKDNSLKEAKKIMEETGKRVFVGQGKKKKK